MLHNTSVTKFESLRGKAFTQIPQGQLDTIRGGQAAVDAIDSTSCSCVSQSSCGCTDCGDIDS